MLQTKVINKKALASCEVLLIPICMSSHLLELKVLPVMIGQSHTVWPCDRVQTAKRVSLHATVKCTDACDVLVSALLLRHSQW